MNQNQITMKQHYNYHSFEIRTNKFTLGGIEIHPEEVREDDLRLGVKEKFIFNGITYSFLIFEVCIGVKVYETII